MMQVDITQFPMSDLRNQLDRVGHKWLDRDDAYWLARLMQEVGELASVVARDHDDTMAYELTQIASIAIAWRNKLVAEERE